jgi:hypothetical protein
MPIAKTKQSVSPWLLLAFSLPRKGASLRVSVWRKLQRYGSLPLGNSGYLLPNSPANREKFEWLATTIRGSNGEASVLEVQAIDNYSGPQLMKRFSDARSQDYRALLKVFRGAASRSPTHIARLRQRFQDIVSIDFFGSPLREEVERTLAAMKDPNPQLAPTELGKISRGCRESCRVPPRPHRLGPIDA